MKNSRSNIGSIIDVTSLLFRAWIFLWILSAAIVAAQTKVPTSIGTAFVVNPQGYLVTAYHVIRDKSQILVGPFDTNRWRVARVVKIDESKDLALLEARIDRPALSMALWSEVPIGLEALVIGYPQPRVQGLSKKVTLGIVNGVRIEGVDAGYFQLSAEVQKGNSGGPVLAPNGEVIGVVLSKLNALSLAEKTGDLAQNVNYALKSSSLLQFLNEAGIKMEVRPLDMSQAVRPFETYRKAEASVLAVIARDLPNKPQGKPALPDTLNLVPADQ